jgi:hypothetical protein
VAVSEAEEEGAAVEACFNFLLFLQFVISRAFHLIVNQAEEIVEDVVGAVVVVLVGEGEYEVFSFVHQFSVFLHTRSFTRWWYPRTRWSPKRSGRPGQGWSRWRTWRCQRRCKNYPRTPQASWYFHRESQGEHVGHQKPCSWRVRLR